MCASEEVVGATHVSAVYSKLILLNYVLVAIYKDSFIRDHFIFGLI